MKLRGEGRLSNHSKIMETLVPDQSRCADVTGLYRYPPLFVDVVRGFIRPDCPRNPQWPSQPAGPRTRTRQRFPALIHAEREVRVDEDVAVTIVRSRSFHADHLMPAVHPADWIGMNGESDVLMNACIPPPNTLRVRICRFIRRD